MCVIQGLGATLIVCVIKPFTVVALQLVVVVNVFGATLLVGITKYSVVVTLSSVLVKPALGLRRSNTAPHCDQYSHSTKDDACN